MEKLNVNEIKFWFENGDYAGIAVLGEGPNPDVWFCYSRSDIFLGTAKYLTGCRDLILGY